MFQNNEVVIRPSRGASMVREVMAGHRPALWVSDLYSAQQGHAADWQICLAHQLRDCQFAIEAGEAIFTPRMKMLLLRAFVLARRRHHLAATTRHQYRQRLERELRPTATWRKVTGGFRSDWGPDCDSAWKKAPLGGVIGVQKGPLW